MGSMCLPASPKKLWIRHWDDQIIQDVIGELCTRNDDGVLAVSDKDKKIAWKSHHKKLLSTEFACNRNTLSQVDIATYLP